VASLYGGMEDLENSNTLALINEKIDENGKCILNETGNKLEIETLDSRIILKNNRIRSRL
jgi:hypothetical protein